MKKIMLGLVAAFALVSFSMPVRAQEAGGDAAKTDAPAKKKGKKAKKGAAADGDAAAAPAADGAKK